MSRVYHCVFCQTEMSFSIIPLCSTCRIESAIQNSRSYDSSSESFSDMIKREVRERDEWLTRRGF